MESQLINNFEDLKRILDVRRENVRKIAGEEAQKIAEEVAEKEWDLFELNLFVSCLGNLEESNEKVTHIRKLNREGKINLKKYEDMAENL